MKQKNKSRGLKPTRVGQMFLSSDLSMSRLAKQIGTAEAQIFNWTYGIATPGANSLIKIAKGMNVTTDYLLGLTDNRGHSDTPLKDLMEDRKISANKLAQELKIHRTTVQRMLNGKHGDTAILCKVADYFGVTTDFLLGR